MTLTRREKFMIVIGLIVVSVAAYTMYFLLPYLEDTSQANQRLAAAQSRINILNAQSANIGTMKDNIATLENELKDQGATIADGIDHARILLYLEELAKGRAVDVSIQTSVDQPEESKFLTQSVAMDFRTTWPQFVAMMEDLKQNKLYHRVAYLKSEYRQQELQWEQEDPAATETAGETPVPTVAPVTDKNVIYVHLELVFYAFELSDGQQLEQPLPPTASDKKDTLFPAK